MNANRPHPYQCNLRHYHHGLFLHCCSLILLLGNADSFGDNYNFIVAGHAYGAHDGRNRGLHPEFKDALKLVSPENVDFLILTGDVVRTSSSRNWKVALNELNDTQFRYYLVMGNHDTGSAADKIFTERYGGTYYSFPHQSELYIVLNSQESELSISPKQIQFLKNQFSQIDPKILNIFIFMHELLWNSHERYKEVKSNGRSRHDNIVDKSNFWQDVYPLLEGMKPRKIFVVAGDVGGNPDAIPAFYEKRDHIYLIASGMGEVIDENYLYVEVRGGIVNFILKPLSQAVKINNLENYTIKNLPDYYSPKTNTNSLKSDWRFFAQYNWKYRVIFVAFVVVLIGALGFGYKYPRWFGKR